MLWPRSTTEMLERKPLWQLMQQWEAMRRQKKSHPSPHAKSERNAEIVWMHGLGVPVSHIARLHDVSVTRVRAIIKGGK
jgi:hypothetical protein